MIENKMTITKAENWDKITPARCPFCGGRAGVGVKILKKPKGAMYAQYYVRCIRCGAQSPVIPSSVQFCVPSDIGQASYAVKRWNALCQQAKSTDSSLSDEKGGQRKTD